MSRRFLLQAAIVLTGIAPAAVQGQSPAFTLEQVLSAPFPEELTAAPTGGAIAWVFNAAGARNIWVAAPPDYAGRPITSSTEDDGLEVSELAWTPDAKAIVYSRGTNANGSGEHPNPRGVAAGTDQEVWLAEVAGSAPRKISEGSSPAVSPQGDRVAFVKGGQIWWAKLGDSPATEELVHAHGSSSSLRWSPDGNRLAFVSERGDHAFVGILDLATRVVSYAEPSVDRDVEPAWSPDGKRLAFIRLAASPGEVPFTPQRAKSPWSIHVFDVASGTGKEIWKADSGRGSGFREFVATNQVLWTASDRLVFPWEKDGWTHLYALNPAGGSPTLLTPGGFEVEHVSLSADRRQLVYSSNQGDIDRRHVWRVAGGGGAPVPLSSGAGLEWSPVSTSDGKAVAFIRSDTKRPPRPAIVVGTSQPRDLAPNAIPTDFPEAKLVEPSAVLFQASDGMTIHGQLFLPRDLKPGERRPAMVFFHGGSQRQMLLGWHYMYYYRNAYAMNQYLASLGYVVLSVNYRSGIGYGMEFREALGYGALGASEYNDVAGAGLYLRSRADVDPAKVGLWGGSYGGYLTALGLARASDLFAAGVDIHGVHDWNLEIQNWVTAYDPHKQEEFARLAFSSSPMASVSTWRSPVLLIHGDDDRNVQFSQTIILAAALRKQGVEFEQLIFPEEVHDFLTHAHWIAAYRAGADFLRRKLGR